MDVRTLCLGVLTLGEASGYEIKKKLENDYSHFYDASFGSIYPALNRLQSEGLVTCTHEAQARRPDKKVYSVTPEGRLELIRELSEPPGPDRIRSEFMVTLIFADLLPPSYLAQILDERIAYYRGCLDEFENRASEHGSPAQSFVSGFGQAIYSAALQYIEDNRHLVEGESLLSQVERDRSRNDTADITVRG